MNIFKVPQKRQVKFFVPTIGTRLTLTKDWSFGIANEQRNKTLLKAIGYEGRMGWLSEASPAAARMPDLVVKVVEGVTLPQGTTLVVDRVYIRRGKDMDKFDSITFKVEKGCPDKRFDKCRFWVKLREANKIECEISELWMEDD